MGMVMVVVVVVMVMVMVVVVVVMLMKLMTFSPELRPLISHSLIQVLGVSGNRLGN